MLKQNWALLLVLCGATAWGKGPIVKVDIRGDGLATPIEITDTSLISTFSIWNGPSVRTYVAGVEQTPAHLDPDAKDGRFTDWPKGIATNKPAGLRRFEVTFYIETPRNGIREYILAYEADPSAGKGYVYLPMWENSLIWHGIEGNWLHASKQWNEFALPLIAEHSSQSPQIQNTEFRCGGIGSMTADGAIAIQFFRDGQKTGKFRYSPSDEPYYSKVMAHVGDMRPGVEKAISCWPSRS
jgi:hypothetical protein